MLKRWAVKALEIGHQTTVLENENAALFQRLQRAYRAFRHIPAVPVAVTSEMNRLTQDWLNTQGNANLKSDTTFAPCANAAGNWNGQTRSCSASPFMRRMSSPGCGFTMQNKAAFANGRPDLNARKIVEEGWKEWCRPKNASLTGEESLLVTVN
jgi:hypothetical protein